MVAPPLPISAPTRNARILVVDDDLALLEALPETLRLRLWRLEVETCCSPLAALARLRTTSYDVVLTDIAMPEMNGFLLLDEVKKLAPTTSVVIITAHGDRALALEAIKAGAADCLDKPLDRDVLSRRLKALLKARAAVS